MPATAKHFLAWSETAKGPVVATLGTDAPDYALFGRFDVATTEGTVTCHPVFQLWADICANHDPKTVEETTGVPAAEVERTAEMLWRSRPVAYMAWSGLEQQSNATQIARSIGLLYALTGNYDAKGGNVEFPVIPSANLEGDEFLSADQRAKTLGRAERPLGVARFDSICSADLYRAILDHRPYRVGGLVSFGSNLLMAHADGATALKAFQALDFYVHVDLFMNPSAEFADIVLPVTSPFESEALKVGFDISEAACSLVQLRRQLVPPQGESRADTRIIFDLACRMELGKFFWDGDIDAAYQTLLAPSGITLEALRQAPEGIHVPLDIRYRKF